MNETQLTDPLPTLTYQPIPLADWECICCGTIDPIMIRASDDRRICIDCWLEGDAN